MSVLSQDSPPSSQFEPSLSVIMTVVSSLLVRVAALLHLIVATATTSTGVINLDSNNGVYHGLTGDAVISTVEEIDSTGRRAIDLSASHLSEGDVILLLKRVLLQCVGRGAERDDGSDGDGDEIQPLSAAVKNLDLSMNRLSPSGMVAVINEICQAQEDDTDDSYDTDSATSPALEELDLSMNDIGGHGANQPDERLLESFRKLFESRSDCAPRTLILQNCSIGPAILRSIGRVRQFVLVLVFGTRCTHSRISRLQPCTLGDTKSIRKECTVQHFILRPRGEQSHR